MKLATKLWKYPGPAAWYFLTIPKKESVAIKKKQEGKLRRGWGSVRVRVVIGTTSWDTSVFPDSSSGCYLLPVKALVRKKEGLMEGENVAYRVQTL